MPHDNHQNKIQLITYADSMGGDLVALHTALNTHFKDAVRGIHILPFYPSSADRGFAPLTHMEVDPQFGTWDNIRALSRDYTLMSDLIVNHISAQSMQFQDYLAHGEQSAYADWFVTPAKLSRHFLPATSDRPRALRGIDRVLNALRRADTLFHTKGVNKRALSKVYRPRPMSPFQEFTLGDGLEVNLWCTFSREQIDLDVHNEDVRQFLTDTIAHLSANGISFIRLDAAGYAIKKRGTDSFMIPQAYEFISWIAELAHAQNIKILPEIHTHYIKQIHLARTPGVDYVYDFQLPLLLVHTLMTGDASRLVHWLDVRPEHTITTLDTHDGLPIPDIADLLSPNETDAVVDYMKANGGNEVLRASGDGADNLDIYQVNCTYYSALGADDDAYILSRVVQFFTPGIPQVYYVGMLAGANDIELFERTNVGRDVNRHSYAPEEIATEVQRPVVQRLLTLMELRNAHSAFEGDFSAAGSTPTHLRLAWKHGAHSIRVDINIATRACTIYHTDLDNPEHFTTLTA